jgi:large subunit ribosomal protein L15
MADRIGLHSIAPSDGARKSRKRVGRGEGSGYGRTAGRGQKGAGARSGSKRKAGYEGGQNPLHMRMRKLRGPHMKKSMPFEPFRSHSQPVNLADLNRFDEGAEVTPETLRERGLATRKSVPVKILAKGELETKSLKISAHAFSAAAKERIEAAGGTCTVIPGKRAATKAGKRGDTP